MAVSTQHGLACAIALVVDVAVYVLPPWRVPRSRNSNARYAGEQLLYFLTLAAVTVLLAAAAEHRGWWQVEPLSICVAVGAGFLLAVPAGLLERPLWRGHLAFLCYDGRSGHAGVRAVAIGAAALLEEPAFRGPALLQIDAGWRWTLILMAGLAFVGHHQLLAGVVVSRKQLGRQVAAGLVFAALTVWSGSLVPALVAHFLANTPQLALEVQQVRMGRQSRDDEFADF